MWTLSDRSVPIPLVDIPTSAGNVVSAAFDHALETNPIPMFMLSRELNDARSRGPVLPQAEASEEATRQGVSMTVPKEGMTKQALDILIQRRKDDIAFQVTMQRSPGGVVAGGGEFAAGFAGSLMDPVNAAFGMVPVLGGTKYAAGLAAAATATSRAGFRLGIGAAEGVVGAAAVEMPTLSLHRDLQDDYSLNDSLANIAFGSFASAGLRAGGGALRDLHLGIDRARQLDALRAVEPEVWAQMRREAANAQERSFWTDLEAGFQRGEGVPDGLRAQFEAERAAPEFQAAMDAFVAERALPGQRADEAIARRMENERQKALAAGMEPDEALKAVFQKTHPETERLLTQAQIGERILRQSSLDEVRNVIASGRGLVFIPENAAQAEAAISGETHAAALRASVAQAVQGQRVDPTPVVRTDKVFGAQRMPPEQAKLAAESARRPENKAMADPDASRRAETSITQAGKPAAPDTTSFANRVQAKASGEAPTVAVPKTPAVIELETLLSAAEARLKAEGVEGEALAAAKTKLDEQMKSASDYEKALAAVADCVGGKK